MTVGKAPPEGSSETSPGSGVGRLDFFSELKRRNVYRVGAAYLAIAFAALEGASMVFPTLGLGPAVYNGLVVVSLLGFPVALVLAWAFDLTSAGIRRAEDPGTAAVADRWGRVKAGLVGAGFVLVVWAGVGLWRAPGPEGAVPSTEPVLAVLPFDDFSPGQDQAYFADGLHEELLHQLAILRGIRLTSRTSVSHFRGSPATVRAIADSLGARYVLEGSVRRAGDSAQITVQLIDAPADQHLWSETHRVAMSLDEIFGLQEQLATRVASALGGTLGAGTGRTLGAPPTSSLEAYQAYLRGLHYSAQFDVPSMQKAVDELNRALELDPEFGRAHGKLSLLYGILNNFGGGTQGELLPLVQEHARLAMEYAPDNPASHMALAGSLWAVDRDWDGSRREMETALELDPDFADARWALAEWHGVIDGNTERGLEVIREAARLNPFAVEPLAVEAWILTVGGRYAESARAYGRLVELNPGVVGNVTHRAEMLALEGRVEEARQELQAILPAIPSPRPISLAVPLAWVGDTTAARAVLADAVAMKRSGGSVPASGIAAAYAVLGDVDKALDWLERSFDQEGGIYYLRSPEWQTLWGQPRFQTLWDRIALPGEVPERRTG